MKENRIKSNLANEKDWNDFWAANKSNALTKESWSKKRICNILKRFIHPNMKVLDAGSGSGFFSRFFIDNNCYTYSLDYSNEALQITRNITQNKSSAYLQIDLLDTNFGENFKNTFDLIFSDGLLEHFSKDEQQTIIYNWKNAKRKEGLIVTIVPNKYSLWEIIRPIFMPGINEKPFTLSELSSTFYKQNFTCIQKGGINTIPFSFSPDIIMGKWFGMLLYIIVK